MNLIRNFIVVLTVVFFVVCSVFAANEGLTQNAAGDYVYSTTISSLVNRRVFEEIKLINNSSYPLTHVTCTITINGKNHDMRPMPVLKLSDSEGFDGYYEDDMNREFPRYFGKDGKFSKSNNNVVTFTFKFRDHANAVAITDVYDGEEDLCFVISDNAIASQVYQSAPAVAAPAPVAPAVAAPVQTPATTTVPAQVTTTPVAPAQDPAPVAPAVVPAQPAETQPAATTQTNNNSESKIVTIDGKKYLINDGKAYPVQ